MVEPLKYTAARTTRMFWFAIKRLALGMTLIVAASIVLLVADLDRRSGDVPRIAILQHASTSLLDEGARGIIDALAERGFVKGRTMDMSQFNSHGDMATGNAIARQVTTGEYDLVLTVSTPSMQAVANNNRDGRTIHIFGVVADPFSAGIGLNADDPLDHPAHMTGQSSFMPVEESFELTMQMLPGLQRVGIAWNPAESNSETFTLAAREACARLGLTVIEANVDGSSGVTEAVNTLVTRGAQVVWIGGDNTMMAAIDSAIATARRGGVPVVTITPGEPTRGSLLDIGLDFYAVGRMVGTLTADVLEGADPATIPVRDVRELTPRRIVANFTALEGLREAWRIPDEVLQRATVVVDDKGVHRRTTGATQGAVSKRW